MNQGGAKYLGLEGGNRRKRRRRIGCGDEDSVRAGKGKVLVLVMVLVESVSNLSVLSAWLQPPHKNDGYQYQYYIHIK